MKVFNFYQRWVLRRMLGAIDKLRQVEGNKHALYLAYLEFISYALPFIQRRDALVKEAFWTGLTMKVEYPYQDIEAQRMEVFQLLKDSSVGVRSARSKLTPLKSGRKTIILRHFFEVDNGTLFFPIEYIEKNQDLFKEYADVLAVLDGSELFKSSVYRFNREMIENRLELIWLMMRSLICYLIDEGFVISTEVLNGRT